MVQAILSSDEIAIGASLLAFTQFMGGAVFLSAATALFSSGISLSLQNYASEVNATAIIDTGIIGLASLLSASDSRDVAAAYSKAITQTFVSPSSQDCLKLANIHLVPCFSCRSYYYLYELGHRMD